MAITIHIPTPLRDSCGGAAELHADGVTVRAALDHACERHPALRAKLFDANRLRPFVNAYVNEEDIRFLDELDTQLSDGDQLLLIPAVAGG